MTRKVVILNDDKKYCDIKRWQEKFWYQTMTRKVVILNDDKKSCDIKRWQEKLWY